MKQIYIHAEELNGGTRGWAFFMMLKIAKNNLTQLQNHLTVTKTNNKRTCPIQCIVGLLTTKGAEPTILQKQMSQARVNWHSAGGMKILGRAIPTHKAKHMDRC
jgi:hypothetical protein